MRNNMIVDMFDEPQKTKKDDMHDIWFRRMTAYILEIYYGTV